MSRKHIPSSTNLQLKRIFGKDFTMDSPMIPRKFYCNGTQCSIVIKVPTTQSNFVMTAEILIANASVALTWSMFIRRQTVVNSGTHIVYQFKNWNYAEMFLNHLPRRMPSNNVTVIVSTQGKPMSIGDFMNQLEYGCNALNCNFMPMRGLERLKNELRSVGIAD